MNRFETMTFSVFSQFANEWAIVAAGSMEHHNGCTIGWGSMGTLWTRPDGAGSIITVYVHPARYTLEFLKSSSTFTVSFFPEKYKKALGYMGYRSGRDEDKAMKAGLTPIPVGDSVGYKEANLTFLCRKLYQHQFSKEDLAPDIQAYYKDHPKAYPPDENGEWQPHWAFIGEILDVNDSRTR